MPIKYKSNCKLCQLIKKDPLLKKRFYTSTYFNVQGKESLNEIFEDVLHPYVGRPNMYNHAKKHGNYAFKKRPGAGESMKEFQEKERLTKQALKTLEKVAPQMIVDGEVMPNKEVEEGWEDGLKELLKQGGQDLKKGKMKINASQYVTALKIMADKEARDGSKQDDFVTAMALAALSKK